VSVKAHPLGSTRAGLLLLCLTFAPTSLASEPDPAAVAARVDSYLSTYDTRISAERWRALGPQAAPILSAIAQDTAALPTRRAKALAALGVVDAPTAAPLVRGLATDASAPYVVRSTAVRAAPSVLGPKEATALLLPILRGPHSSLRARAGEALATTGTTGCQAVVLEASRRPGEESLQKTAARCQGQSDSRSSHSH
jgi:HEAT repeat protein